MNFGEGLISDFDSVTHLCISECLCFGGQRGVADMMCSSHRPGVSKLWPAGHIQ